ncbi:hypothetical protein SAMN05444920_1489 [Nonomuraea solani]|uniref:Uncharacterized protein n=1 Tax=Nonomuraea solani TaxID=1144553 RepID=A0A1H6F183_9ACTN|nr:DUF5955 family protein [Nonomuraea solani]SEH03918.1 hypothetical protein SAMN05444920_1489 [Nonomuraea solani]
MAMFEQHFGHVGEVYNVGGNLYLSKDSSAKDFAAAVARIRAELAELSIPEADRGEIDAELGETLAQADADKPDTDQVVGRLERIKARLESMSGVGAAVLGVATAVGNLAAWAAKFFV